MTSPNKRLRANPRQDYGSGHTVTLGPLYHGGAYCYDTLIPGGGVDGDGVYLTWQRSRAVVYAVSAVDRLEFLPESTRAELGGTCGFIMTAYLDIDPARIWDERNSDMVPFNLADYTNQGWLQELVEKHGDLSKYLSGSNARTYLAGAENLHLLMMGYDAIVGSTDVIAFFPDQVRVHECEQLSYNEIRRHDGRCYGG